MCVHSMCVCLSSRLLIAISVMSCDMGWLNKFYSFYIYVAAVVSIASRDGLRTEVCCRKQPNKTTLALCKPLLTPKKLFKRVVAI